MAETLLRRGDAAASAVFSEDGVFRYRLQRTWAPSGRKVGFVLLNPSTADERQLDPTLKRCFAFAHEWGFGSMHVANIFALRSTDPEQLYRTKDPVGPLNDDAILSLHREVDETIVGWGQHGAFMKRGEAVLKLLQAVRPVKALKVTNGGAPGHPLYLPGNLLPLPYAGATA